RRPHPHPDRERASQAHPRGARGLRVPGAARARRRRRGGPPRSGPHRALGVRLEPFARGALRGAARRRREDRGLDDHGFCAGEPTPAAAGSFAMNVMVSIDELCKLPLFAGLAPESLDRLSDLLQPRTVPAGTQLASAHQKNDKVFLILEGSVKVQHYTADGAEVTLALLGPGNTVGEMGLVGPGHSADVITREMTTLLWMERRT